MLDVDKREHLYINAEKIGGDICITYLDHGVKKRARISNYQPTLYSKYNGTKETGLKELVSGEQLYAHKINSVKEADQIIKKNHDEELNAVYGNRNFQYTFLNEVFGDCSDAYSYYKDKYDIKKLINVFYLDIECPTGDEGGFPDVENAAWEINAITIYSSETEKYHVWGKHTFAINLEIEKLLRNDDITLNDIEYVAIDDEKARHNNMLEWWGKHYPDAISGWNTTHFDLSYMYRRFKNIGVDPNKMSPWGKVTIKEGEFFGKPEYSINIAGVADLDYLLLYKKNRFKTQESYKLGFIGDIELDRTKLDYSDVAGNLRTLHKKDWNLFIAYNVVDVALVKQLDDALNYMDITFAVAYYAGINYGHVKSPVMTWENILYKECLKEGVILPNKKDNEHESYEGAFVKFPQVGRHKWILSFDLNSLYPHIIMQWNISPETITDVYLGELDIDKLVEGAKIEYPDKDYTIAASGYTFRKDINGIAPRMMKKLYAERKEIKWVMLQHEQQYVLAKEELVKRGLQPRSIKYVKPEVEWLAGKTEDDVEYNNIPTLNDDELLNYYSYHHALEVIGNGNQMVRKILLNSFYGALAQISFSCFDVRLAKSITLSGQLAIRWVARKVNEFLNKALSPKEYKDFVVYTDTDSIYVGLDDVVKFVGYQNKQTQEIVDMLDRFGHEHMERIIADGYNDLKNYVNGYEQKMIMKREVISENAIFCSKKRYAMSVWNSEGVAFAKPKIKMMGLDVVKSSTPAIVRDAMKQTITIMLNGTERDLHNFTTKFKAEFKNAQPEQIAFPRGVNKLEETYCYSANQKTGVCKIRDDVTVPINSRAAIMYNNAIKVTGLDAEYETILNADKIKYLHLLEPNKYDTNVMGFIDELPEGLGLHSKIDYDLMYEKTYGKPMQDLCDIVGWTLDPVITIDMLFGSPQYADDIDGSLVGLDFIEDADRDEVNTTNFDYHNEFSAFEFSCPLEFSELY